MIKGLYEAHLPVKDLKRSIAFYKKLGLELSHIHDHHLAFLVKERRKLAWFMGNATSRIRLPSFYPPRCFSRNVGKFEVISIMVKRKADSSQRSIWLYAS